MEPPEQDGAMSVDEGASSDEAKPKLLPKHTIFLSHSGRDKQFVDQLCEDFEKAQYYPFFDQRSDSLPMAEKYADLIVQAAKNCLVAVIVLSEAFLTSKWPLRELFICVEATGVILNGIGKSEKSSSVEASRKVSTLKIPTEAKATKSADTPSKSESSGDRKLFPLFYTIGPDSIKKDAPTVLWRKLVKKELVRMHGQDRDFEDREYCEAEKILETNSDFPITQEMYHLAIKTLLRYSGLDFEKTGSSVVKYRGEVVKEISRMVPRHLEVNVDGIKAYDRLCKVIDEMFVGKNRSCSSLGLYGKAGSGKSIICCEAMLQYFQEQRFGFRYCRVKLDSDIGTGGRGVDEKEEPRSAMYKKRQERIKMAIQQLFGLDKRLSKVMSELEGQKHLQNKLNSTTQPVFLVVDNVSESSLEEAKWYANARLPSGSYLLVTSRSREILVSILGSKSYCKPFPSLNQQEALELFLSNVLPTDDSVVSVNEKFKTFPGSEQDVVLKCVRRCAIEDYYFPRLMTKLAFFLHERAKDDISNWSEHLDDADDNMLGLEYRKLDKTSQRIFLDLATFASDIRFTHMDFHSDSKWDEFSNSTLVVEFIAMLHNISEPDAKLKLRNLRSSSFLKETEAEIQVSDDYYEFAQSVIQRWDDGVEQWSMVCHSEEARDFVDGVERVALIGLRFDYDFYNISAWRSVKFLFIFSVRELQILDLQGLRSLRVLMVKECKDMEKILCACNKLSSTGGFCYEKERGCLSELRVVQLEYLPKLKEASFPMHSRKLETLWFYECPNLSCMPDLHQCKKLQRLRLPCGDFEGFKGLKSNSELIELAFHWETETVRNFTENMRKNLLTDVMNLSKLKVLDIVDEREVYDWIPAGECLNVHKLVHLTFLDLSCATSITEVKGLEKLSELTSLALYGCCELRKLPNLFAFKKLKMLCIAHCHSLDMSAQRKLDKYDQAEHDEHLELDYFKEFHAAGESCSFGEHKCCDPHGVRLSAESSDAELEGEAEAEVDDEEEEEYHGKVVEQEGYKGKVEDSDDYKRNVVDQEDGEGKIQAKEDDEGNLDEQEDDDESADEMQKRAYSEFDSGDWEDEDEVEEVTCRRCDKETWESKYMAKPDMNEPLGHLALEKSKDEETTATVFEELGKAFREPGDMNLEHRPQRQSRSGKAGTPTEYPVSVSAMQDEQVRSTIPAAQWQPDAVDKSLNILLLGETGVGKSTFINALANYLTFRTLDEACDGEMQSLIYSEFTTYTDDYEEKRIVVGELDNDEIARSKEVGGSVTQKCKAYTFNVGATELPVRLIDTPGIGDTRGFDQDVVNMKGILSHLSEYDTLSAICILLKPNEERLTTSLKYCIVQLLTHLHKDATSNILFCFTNSRSTNFKVGGTLKLLRTLLSDASQTAAIKFNASTMYYFDSEGFRFLAQVHNGIRFSAEEENMMRLSWKQSTNETMRLIGHVASLTPHNLQSTLSLNHVRDMLTTIEIPLAKMTAAVQENMDEIRKVITELLHSQSNIREKYNQLYIKETYSMEEKLGHLRTICTSASCEEKICHDKCSPMEDVGNKFVNKFESLVGGDYIFCYKLMPWPSNKCSVCHCPNDAHKRVSSETKMMVRQREDEDIRRAIDEMDGGIDERKKLKSLLDEKEKSYNKEMKVVVEAAALFAGFLKQQAIITYHAATQEYLREQIKKKKHSEDQSTEEGRARVAELESLLRKYERDVENFKNREGSHNGRDVTTEDVTSELNKLYALPMHGECLRDSLRIKMNDVEEERRRAAGRAGITSKMAQASIA